MRFPVDLDLPNSKMQAFKALMEKSDVSGNINRRGAADNKGEEILFDMAEPQHGPVKIIMKDGVRLDVPTKEETNKP